MEIDMDNKKNVRLQEWESISTSLLSWLIKDCTLYICLLEFPLNIVA